MCLLLGQFKCLQACRWSWKLYETCHRGWGVHLVCSRVCLDVPSCIWSLSRNDAWAQGTRLSPSTAIYGPKNKTKKEDYMEHLLVFLPELCLPRVALLSLFDLDDLRSWHFFKLALKHFPTPRAYWCFFAWFVWLIVFLFPPPALATCKQLLAKNQVNTEKQALGRRISRGNQCQPRLELHLPQAAWDILCQSLCPTGREHSSPGRRVLEATCPRSLSRGRMEPEMNSVQWIWFQLMKEF